MASNEELKSFILPLIDTIQSDRGDARVNALGTVWNLSAVDENGVYMGSKDLGLLPALVAVISSDRGGARVNALGTLMNLSVTEENRAYMGSKDLGLAYALVAVVSSDRGDARMNALGTLWNLSALNENGVYMGSKDLGLLPALVAVISSDRGHALLTALGLLINLSVTEDNRAYMGSKDLGLVFALVEVVLSNRGEAGVSALGTLWNLSAVSENGVYMGSKDLGLLPALVAVASSSSGDARMNVLGILMNLSVTEDNRAYMGSKDLGLLPALIAVVSSDSGDARVKALGTLRILSSDDDIGVYMGSKDLGLLPVLVAVVSSDSGDTRLTALGMLMNLSATDENRAYMGSKDLDLLPALIAVVSSDSGDARVKALGTLWNLSLRHENIDYLVCCHGMSVVLAALQLSPKGSDSFKTSLTVLMVSGRILSAARDLFVAGGVEIISPLLDGGGVDGIKAAIILSFLLGKEESRGTQLSLLESKPQLTDLLESIFNNTVNGLGGDGYEFGNFDLVVIVAAIASMAVSDNNKAILSQRPTILLCLFQVLSLFLDDSPPIPYRGTGNSYGVGGGGQDIESAESAIESLQLLSFVYENDSDLRQHYKEIGVDVLFSMKRIMTHPKLSNNAKQGAQYLRNRLEEKTVPLPTVETAIPSVVEHKKHLMLSYAWGCKKELVISLQEKLTSFGVEVWRDETGSSLLSKMQGATDDIMAKAIELSHTVVVCVSPHYKASANCRQEGKYTNAMYKKGMLNIIYVMMDGDYYKSVDGWLGIMLGDSLWYPLWDAQQIIQTASEIVTNISACSFCDATQHLALPTLVPTIKPTTKTETSQAPNYDEVWTLLTDPSKASDPDRLTKFLSELGLSKALELVDCDNEMWNDIASYLKPIPKRALLRILARKNPEK